MAEELVIVEQVIAGKNKGYDPLFPAQAILFTLVLCSVVEGSHSDLQYSGVLERANFQGF